MVIWVYSFLSENFFLSLFTQQIKIQVFSQLCRMLHCWFYCNAVNHGQCCCFQQEPRYATVVEIKGCIISWSVLMSNNNHCQQRHWHLYYWYGKFCTKDKLVYCVLFLKANTSKWQKPSIVPKKLCLVVLWARSIKIGWN